MYLLKYILIIQIIHTPSLCDVAKELYHERWKEIYSAPVSVGEEALFGYSVSYQFSKTTLLKRLIVGAPKADKFGKVYSCEVKADPECKEMMLPGDDSTTVKNESWFGATVKAWNSHVVACAPRKEYKTAEKIGIFSSCYYDKDPSQDSLVELEIPQNKIEESNKYYYGNKLLYEYKMTTFGWSMDVVDNIIYIGGPAMTTGRVIKYATYDNKVIDPKPTLLRFKNGTILFNFGYSIASGNFLDKDKRVHAISSPYGKMGKGKIIFFNENDVVNSVKYTDDDVGTIFGSALCFVDLGSPTQHLLVGAPTFSPLKASASNDSSASSEHIVPYDIGAVHLYVYNKRFNDVVLLKTIVGQQNGGYFGNAIVNVGDLNGDHVDEVAIAAPYEDGGQGAVYIYSGADLLKDQPSWMQRIKAESRPEDKYRGLSLAVLQDNDENGCNELAIGMPGVNQVMIVRCMASVNTSLHLNLPPKPITDRTLRSFQFNPCLHVTFPEKPATVKSSIDVIIQITHPNASIEDAADDKTYRFAAGLTKGVEKYCKAVKVLLPKDGDYDQPIVFNMTAKLSVDPMENKKFDPTLVTLSESRQLWSRDEVMVPGSDPSVTINSTMQSEYLIGSTPSENVSVVVTNAGGVAYDLCLRMRFDGGNASIFQPAEGCAPNDEGCLCRLSEPLHAGSSWIGITQLDTSTITSNSKYMTILVELYRCSTNARDRGRVQYNKTITLKSDPKLISVKGSSNTGLFMTLTRNDLNSETTVEHVYSIMNRGYSTWENIKCDITVPSYVNAQVTGDSSTTCYKIDDEHICSYIHICWECNVKKVKGNNQVDINVVMDILPTSPITANISKNINATVVTHIDLRLGSGMSQELTTVISLNDLVPLWIMIVASLVGFLVLLLLAFALYECGFLRRKNKDKLVKLKADVKRQTILRQTMHRRRSTINATATQHAKLEDRERLLDLPAENVAEDRRVVVEYDVGFCGTTAGVH